MGKCGYVIVGSLNLAPDLIRVKSGEDWAAASRVLIELEESLPDCSRPAEAEPYHAREAAAGRCRPHLRHVPRVATPDRPVSVPALAGLLFSSLRSFPPFRHRSDVLRAGDSGLANPGRTSRVMTTPTGKRLAITVATASPRKGLTMAHHATNPTAADLDAADARLRTLEARRATAGASCSSTDKAAREKALRLNAKLRFC